MSSSSSTRPRARGRGPRSRANGSSHGFCFFPIFREPSASLFPTRAELLRFTAVIAIAASVAFACHFAAGILSRRPKPFCDSIHDSLAYFDDSCEPCPKNALCSDGNFECLHGFQKRGKICMEDGLINQRASQLSEAVEDHVCNEQAQVLCGKAGKSWFDERDVANIAMELLTRSPSGLKDDDVRLVREKVMASIQGILETRVFPDSSKEFKCPESVAELRRPLNCSIRRWLYKNVVAVMISLVLSAVAVYILWRIWKQHALLKRADELYYQVCEILEDSALNKGADCDSETLIVASWLRDHLLTPKERKDTLLWKKVEELMLEDSRIDQYPKMIKGESKVVLEWQVDGALSAKIKKMRGLSKRGGGDAIEGWLENERSKINRESSPACQSTERSSNCSALFS